MIIKLKGSRIDSPVRLFVPKSQRKYFPEYFIVGIDTKKVIEREKDKRGRKHESKS